MLQLFLLLHLWSQETQRLLYLIRGSFVFAAVAWCGLLSCFITCRCLISEGNIDFLEKKSPRSNYFQKLPDQASWSVTISSNGDQRRRHSTGASATKTVWSAGWQTLINSLWNAADHGFMWRRWRNNLWKKKIPLAVLNPGWFISSNLDCWRNLTFAIIVMQIFIKADGRPSDGWSLKSILLLMKDQHEFLERLKLTKI